LKTFRFRLFWSIIASLFLAILFVVGMLSYKIVLHNTAFISGWILLVMVLVLTLFNVRKKLTYPPLFKSATWMQFHIYIGALSVLVFLLHTEWRLPNGVFESIFYCLFVFVAGSGVIGIYLTRTIPRQLAGRGGEVIFERIPMFMKELREQAEGLVIDSLQFNDSTIIADFYNTKLAAYMSAPRPVSLRVFRHDRLCKEYQAELKALHRYLSDEEQEVAEKISDVLVLKDVLDFHHGRQGLLKAWLFVHIPLTYAVLLFMVVHLVLVHAFYGGM
jgi:hypothetical protein